MIRQTCPLCKGTGKVASSFLVIGDKEREQFTCSACGGAKTILVPENK